MQHQQPSWKDDHEPNRNADLPVMIDDNTIDNADARGALGQFIERSTSAPPASSTDQVDSFVGSKLLAHVNGSPNQGSISGAFRSSSVVDSQATTPVSGNPRYGENPAPESDTFRAAFLSNMIDNSGRATAPATHLSPGIFGQTQTSASSRAVIGDTRAVEFGFGSTSTDRSGIGFDPFQRSHSAAPSSPAIAPPPGLPALDRAGSVGLATPPSNDLVRRPASTGLLDSSGSSALRPAAKTLMDLIQEDYPPEDTSPNYFANQAPVVGQQLYGQEETKPSYLSPGEQFQSRPIEHLQNQVQQLRLDTNNGHVQQMQQVPGLQVGAREPSPALVMQQNQSLMAQRYVPTGFEGRDSVNPDIPSSLYPVGQSRPQQQHQIQTQQLHTQQQQPMYVSGTPVRQSQQGAIISGLDGQQQVFYQQQVEVSPSTRLQAQVLPNGQTVYIQAPAPPPQQPNSYSYTTIQYHPQTGHTISEQPQQQTRIISTGPAPMIRQSDGSLIPAMGMQDANTASTPLIRQSDGSLIPAIGIQEASNASTPLIRQSDGSLVPAIGIQDANGAQVTYWPSDVAAQTQAQGGVVIVGAQGTTSQIPQPVPVRHVTSVQQANGVEHHLSPGQQQRHGGQQHVQQHGQQHGSHQYGRGGREKGGGTPGGGARSRRGGNQARRAEPKGHSTSSPLLEEFRTNKSRQWTVPQIEGHVVEFCQDQNGSRFIQQRLELGDRLEQDVVVREILPSIRRLRNDVFGNYVVQKLLDFGSPQVRASIRDTLEGEMLQLSLQMYGCRVVQKALESLEEDDLSRLLAEFHHNVLSCIHDQNGNHVIQKCIEVFNSRAKAAEARRDFESAQRAREQIDFVINDVLVNATTLSCHPFGCRVLQRILEHCDETRKTKLLDEVMKSHKRLLDDQYGNYVIQHVLQYGRVKDRDSILAIVVENGLLSLSRQKFASNVVEKLLKYGNGPQRKAIAREMLKTADDASPSNNQGGDTSVVLLMVRDAYANYVVQTTLDVVPNSDERTLLLKELNRHSEELVSDSFARDTARRMLFSYVILSLSTTAKLYICETYCR